MLDAMERSALAAALDASFDRHLTAARAGHIDAGDLRRPADRHAVLGWTLLAVPIDPVAHLTTAHAEARPHLLRLREHDPAVEVASGSGRFAYTPRKVLRRVLDHALDHLNQVEQWIAWQDHGIVPAPADGWAPSSVTLDEDRLPLSGADLEAWMWRIDRACRLLSARAVTLTPARLDWQPPDAGWPLRRVLHHAARAESLYAAALDDALPDDTVARYAEATRRLGARLAVAAARAAGGETTYVNPYGVVYTAARAAEEALAVEREIGVRGPAV